MAVIDLEIRAARSIAPSSGLVGGRGASSNNGYQCAVSLDNLLLRNVIRKEEAVGEGCCAVRSGIARTVCDLIGNLLESFLPLSP